MRAEELVGRTDQEIAADRLYVGCDVRRRLDGVDVGPGTRGAGSPADLGDVVERTREITRSPDTNQPCARIQQAVELVEVELESLHVKRQPANGEAMVASHQHPGVHVGVMLHARQHDLVAGAGAGRNVPADGSRKMERDRRHVGAEDDFVRGRRVEKIRHCPQRGVNDLTREHRAPKRAAEVGIGLEHTLGHALDDLSRHLRTGRVVEVNTGFAGIDDRQRRKLRPNRVEIVSGRPIAGRRFRRRS